MVTTFLKSNENFVASEEVNHGWLKNIHMSFQAKLSAKWEIKAWNLRSTVSINNSAWSSNGFFFKYTTGGGVSYLVTF